ncbi:MAG: MBL fold metallo-hydrolase [Fibrobacter sp.]|nr:MBL fold metallo-hydrolase [Fibrobacter sp.]
MQIKQFVFNPFGVNCYILSNDKGEAILIDPSVSNTREQAALADYIKSEKLKVVRVLNTHLHLDHVLGNAFVERTFGIKAEAHKDDTFLLDLQQEQAQMFGLPCNDIAPALGEFLNDGDIVEIAEIRLQVIHVAGHSPGGLAFFCENPGKVNGQDNVPPLLFSGDILFAGSRGRSDLYGGDEYALVNGIKNKLLKLPAETVVFPGHGPSTTIGDEKMWY